jgi:hypothetical protein
VITVLGRATRQARNRYGTSYGWVEDRTRIYDERRRNGGFDRLDSANVGRGTFELYARA